MDFLRGISNDATDFSDIKYIIDSITNIIEFISTDEMFKLKEENKTEYEQIIYEKFKDFSGRYFSLFNIILDGELNSLSHLVMMLNTLCMVKTKKISMDEAYAHIREELANQYIYPQFGGKKNFEKTLKERSKKKNHKKNKNQE
jgi:hypothetical protein